MPVNSNEFSAFDEALKKSQPPVPKEQKNEFAAFDEVLATEKKNGSLESKEPLAGVSDGTISTTEPKKKPAIITFGELQTIGSQLPKSDESGVKRGEFITGDILSDEKGESYQIQNGEKVYAPLGDIPKIEAPKELYMKDGVLTDMSIIKEFEDFPKGAEKFEIKRESGKIEKPYSKENLLKLRDTDYGAYKTQLNSIKTYFDIRENLGVEKAVEFSRLQYKNIGDGNLYDAVSNYEFTKKKQKEIINESLTGSQKQKALDRLDENDKIWVDRSFTPQKAKEYISDKLKNEYKGEDVEDLTIDEVKRKLGGGVVNEAILNKYKIFITPESLEEGVLNDNSDKGSRLGYIYNSFLNGMGSVSSGASDLMMQLLTNILPKEAVGGTKEEAVAKWRQESESTIRNAMSELYGVDVSENKQKQYEKEFWTSSIAGLGSSVPMMVSPYGTGLFLGSYDAGLQSINSTKEGSKLPESTKTIFAFGVGAVGALLEKAGLDKIFGKQSKKAAINLATRTISELIEKSATPITKEIFESALEQGVKSLKQKLINAGGKIIKGATVEFLTGSAQEGANVLAEKLTNLSQKKQIFEPQSMGEVAGRVLYSGAQEAVGGGIFGGISAFTSKTRNYIAEKVAEAKTQEDIEKLKGEVLQQAQKNNIGAEESNQLVNVIDNYSKINSKIPSDVENRREVIEKINERDELKKQIDQKKTELENADDAFKPNIQKELDALQGRYDEMNEEVISSSKGGKEAELPEAKPIYKIGDREVSKQEMIDFVESGKAKETTEPLFVEGDTEVEGMVKGLGGEVVEKVAELPKVEEKPTEALKDVESTREALKEVDLANSNIPLPQLEIDGYKRKASENYKLNDAASIAEAYHIAKADGTNPELVKAVESLLSKEQTPTLSGVEQEQTIKQMMPFTDKMVEVERQFKNEGFEIDTDYDNEIQVLDKNGEIVDMEELPDNLKKLASDYEKATMKLGEFDASAREKALAESRKVTEVEAEEVTPKAKAELPVAERENWTQDDYKKELKRLEKEDTKGNAEKIKQLQTELGAKLRSELVKPKKEKVEKVKVKTKEESSVQKALNENEEEGGTFNDLVDKIEGIAFDEENQNLQDAVDAYRKEQKEDFELAGRGDMDAAEAAFMSKIQAELPLSPEKVTTKINKDTKTEYTTKSGKQKINKVNGELIVTDAKTGKRVSKPTERKAIKEWEENFNFSEGEMASEFSGYGGTSQETAYAEHVIETSENPLEIAQIFIGEEYEPTKLSTTEALIAELGIGKITNKSFQRFGDRNLITLSLARAYLNNQKGKSIDVIAKEMSDHYEYEITPQDIVDFMVKFPNGVKDALKMSETEVAQNAYAKFKKLTGLDLTRPLAERLIQKEFDKLSSEQQKLLNQDYERANQLESEYWKAYEETDGFTKESIVSEVKPTVEAKPKEPTAEKVEPKAELPKEEKVGKFEQQARKIAEKISKAELPDFMKTPEFLKDAKKSGMSAEDLQKKLAEAVIQMGKLLDKGVEFSKALKEAVGELVKLRGEENREAIEKGFEDYYRGLKGEVPLEKLTESEFGEGEQGKENKKEFDKLTSTIPNTGEVTKYLSGETIKKYEGEEARNEQEVFVQQLREALVRGVDIVNKGREIFGEDYVQKLLDYVETENLPPANKALIYVSLENEVAKQKIENPSKAQQLEKLQDLVRAKSQAFLRSSSLAINFGRLRKVAEVGYDISRLTNDFFSSKQM